MEFNEIMVKECPGVCRCCLSEGCYKDLGTEYTWMNDTEVYAEMLLDCFDISISKHSDGPNGSNRLICEVCITRLRDACNFKKQVLDSEKKFIDMVARGEFQPKMVIYEAPVKSENISMIGVEGEEEPMQEAEVEFLEDDLDYDEVEQMKEEPSGSSIVVPPLIKSKRGRPKKSDKPEKKSKLVKTEEKAKSSKVVAKDTNIEDTIAERIQKEKLLILFRIILENSTVMPFRWAANKYMCFFCCCSFLESVKLKEHTSEEHKDAKLKYYLRGLKPYRIKLDTSNVLCKKCNLPCNNLEEFLDHLDSVHSLKCDRELSKMLFTFKLSDDGMSCQQCFEWFRFFGTLLQHTNKTHNKFMSFLCEICGQAFASNCNVDRHVKTVHLKELRCHICKEEFKSGYALDTHLSTFHKLNKFKCPKCPEVLGSQYLKRRHLATVHDVKTLQFNCDLCERVFTMRSRLIQHKLRIHERQKSFACDICGFKVFNNELLKRHMVKHTDSRPFECEYCKKSFQRKKTLEYHVRIHTNDRRYVCKLCGKAFVQPTSYKLHMRVHHGTNEGSPWN